MGEGGLPGVSRLLAVDEVLLPELSTIGADVLSCGIGIAGLMNRSLVRRPKSWPHA